VPLAASGERSGPASATHLLEVAGRSVGRLELWGQGDASSGRDDAALLGELLPWIALVLDRARSEAAIRWMTQWLEADLADWDRLERRLERVLAARGRRAQPRAFRRDPPLGS
jgi:hypothetical protein